MAYSSRKWLADASKELHMRIFLLLVTGMLQACGTASGPVIVPFDEASAVATNVLPQQALMPDCQNVSTQQMIWAYEPEFHHSTRDSLAVEVTQTAGRKELNPAEGYREEYAYQFMLQTLGLDGRTRAFQPFCMAYEASVEDVTRAVNATLPFSDDEVDRENESLGLISTSIRDREHSSAKWRDRYSIQIIRFEGGITGVAVYRHLEMLRAGSYVRAKSDGHNEGWFLQRIARSLVK